MFEEGFFSSDSANPHQVDGRLLELKFHRFKLIRSLKIAEGLLRITPQKTSVAMQVSPENPMVGIEGRASLLSNLGRALKASPTFFGSSARPGNMIGRSGMTCDRVKCSVFLFRFP